MLCVRLMNNKKLNTFKCILYINYIYNLLVVATGSKFSEISEKENSRKLEFDTLIAEIENKMLELNHIIEDSQTLADKL